MAFTFRGFGTLHYGRRDYRPDGSYVTTLWIVAAYVPVIPLKSLRLRPTGQTKFYGLRQIPVLERLEKKGLHWEQVLATYAFFAIEVALLVSAELFKLWWLLVPGALLAGLPWLLRRRAHDKMKAEAERRAIGFSATQPE